MSWALASLSCEISPRISIIAVCGVLVAVASGISRYASHSSTDRKPSQSRRSLTFQRRAARCSSSAANANRSNV